MTRSASPVPALARRLTKASRTALERQLRGLLRWQSTLTTWPRPRPMGVGPAVPFVSLYSSRGLRGCAGVEHGEPSTRIARAFLASMHDTRFPRLAPAEQLELRAEVSFLHAPRRVSVTEWHDAFEAGTHGGALVSRDGSPALLLPEIALAQRATAPRFLAALREKSGHADADALFLFETERVVAYAEALPRASADDAAAAWLSGMITPTGEMIFQVDATTALGDAVGEMHHARVATALSALAAHGGFEARRKRALRRLTSDVRAALAGGAVPGWPRDPAHVAGTLALAALAGAPVREALREAAAWPKVRENAWHAAQVALALAADAPAPLWKACVDALAAQPWAPWTARAARARGDAAVLARTLPPLVDSIRSGAPHAGGARMPGARSDAPPEIAVTAAVLEALAGTHAAARAIARGRAFLRTWQCLPDRAPGLVDLRTALGAFPGSPIHPGLRVDVTGHALLALLATG